ncbi:MAG: hypothetical protein LBI92_00385 [Azoarcus sp.]|jgi:hypothetical protein|nr:hypothetical protein [Azoarcus sp.]
MTSEYIMRGVSSASASKTSGAFNALSQEEHDIYVLEASEVLAVSLSHHIESGVLDTKTAVALGPLVAVIFVGVIASLAFDAVDNHFGLTVKMSNAIDQMLEDIARRAANQRDSLGHKFQHMAYSAFEVAAAWLIREGTSATVSYIRRNIDYFLGPR